MTGERNSPQHQVQGRSITEDSSPITLEFPVRLDKPASQVVEVGWMTFDDTAVAGEDYAGQSGLVVFPVGSTTESISVTILGDSAQEPTETFLVELIEGSEVNAEIGEAQAYGTIYDDDTSSSTYRWVEVGQGTRDVWFGSCRYTETTRIICDDSMLGVEVRIVDAAEKRPVPSHHGWLQGTRVEINGDILDLTGQVYCGQDVLRPLTVTLYECQ